MYLGIKSGPDDWQKKLDNDLDIRHVEIYFNLDWLDLYAPLWAWLKESGVAARLHSSTRLAEGIVPNLVTQDEALCQLVCRRGGLAL